jgi:hypothetical protein
LGKAIKKGFSFKLPILLNIAKKFMFRMLTIFTKKCYQNVALIGNKLVIDAFPSGVDVMITIFGDFFPIFSEKIGVFLQYQCYYQKFCLILLLR